MQMPSDPYGLVACGTSGAKCRVPANIRPPEGERAHDSRPCKAMAIVEDSSSDRLTLATVGRTCYVVY